MVFWVTSIIRWIRMTFQAVRNVRNRWAPELQQLSDHIEKIEESLAGTDDCVLDIYSLEETHGNRMDVLEEELASVKACLIALKKEFDAHKTEKEEIKNHFKRMIKRDENEQTSEMDSPPNKGYNLRSHVIDKDSFMVDRTRFLKKVLCKLLRE